MQNSYSLNNLPKTVHSELKGRLFCYLNKMHHDEFFPFNESSGRTYSRHSGMQGTSSRGGVTTWKDTIVECSLL